MNLFHRDEVNRKSDEYPRRDPKPEEEVRNHHWETVNRKKSCYPNGRAARPRLVAGRESLFCRARSYGVWRKPAGMAV